VQVRGEEAEADSGEKNNASALSTQLEMSMGRYVQNAGREEQNDLDS
jgi:hypothetical protein